MNKMFEIETAVDVDLDESPSRLEILSPFINSRVRMRQEVDVVEFNLLPLEWLRELRVAFSSSDLLQNGLYMGNLTAGGEPFAIRAQDGVNLEIYVYDIIRQKPRFIAFSIPDMKTFVIMLYNSIAQALSERKAVTRALAPEQLQTLQMLSAWEVSRGHTPLGGS